MSQAADQRRYILEPPAQQKLGKVSPQLAWEQVRSLVSQCSQEYRKASEELLARENWSPPLDILHLIEVLGDWNPVRALNHLVESAPDLNYRDLMSEPPLQVLQAVLKMLLTNDRVLKPPRDLTLTP